MCCVILYQAFFAAGICLWGLMPGESHDIKAGGPLPVKGLRVRTSENLGGKNYGRIENHFRRQHEGERSRF